MIVADDPGASGGFAWKTNSGDVGCLPHGKDLSAMIKNFKSIMEIAKVTKEKVLFYIEELSGFYPKEKTKYIKCGNCGKAVVYKETKDIMPSSTSLSFGKSIGYVEMLATMWGLKVNYITPRSWQSICMCGKRKGRSQTEWKRHLKEVALVKYPQLGKKITLKTCDAVLIMHAVWVKEIQLPF